MEGKILTREMIEFGEEKVIVYGIGMVGNLVRRYLEIMGQQEKIEMFAVTEKPDVLEFHGYQVRSIDELRDKTDTSTVIVATFPIFHEKIGENLKKYGFKKVIFVEFEMYQEMTEVYILNYMQKNILEGHYDIMYMASDNNKTSGAFLCLIDLARDIKSKGLKPLVVLPEYGNGDELLIEYKIDYIYIRSKNWLVKTNGVEPTWTERLVADNEVAERELEKIIVNNSIGLIHNNTVHTYIGALAAREKGIPVVWHFRENIFEQGYSYANKKYFYELINASTKIITVSEYLKKIYTELDGKKTITIYDGVDINKYYYKREILAGTLINIVIVAAVYPLKRQEDLVNAAIILKERGLQFHIDIVGAGEKNYIDKLNEIIKVNHLENNISIVGRKDNVADYYHKSDISVICSRSEAFGRVCIESMLAGCLVVGAKIGATKELITDQKKGLLYECGNAFDLAEKIMSVIVNLQEMRKIAGEGQRKAYHFFSKESTTNQIMNVYKEIM